ncbi:hypothetical protein U0070_020196 [Myodes glareolus]|uniref:Uncharacterized protein n=1 Tax=Myodes glareolus TaxID=447135 RepID=A0AAW0HWA8_MYOGA
MSGAPQYFQTVDSWLQATMLLCQLYEHHHKATTSSRFPVDRGTAVLLRFLLRHNDICRPAGDVQPTPASPCQQASCEPCGGRRSVSGQHIGWHQKQLPERAWVSEISLPRYKKQEETLHPKSHPLRNPTGPGAPPKKNHSELLYQHSSALFCAACGKRLTAPPCEPELCLPGSFGLTETAVPGPMRIPTAALPKGTCFPREVAGALMFCQHVCLCEVSDPLELELQTAVSCHPQQRNRQIAEWQQRHPSGHPQMPSTPTPAPRLRYDGLLCTDMSTANLVSLSADRFPEQLFVVSEVGEEQKSAPPVLKAWLCIAPWVILQEELDHWGFRHLSK